MPFVSLAFHELLFQVQSNSFQSLGMQGRKPSFETFTFCFLCSPVSFAFLALFSLAGHLVGSFRWEKFLRGSFSIIHTVQDQMEGSAGG